MGLNEVAQLFSPSVPQLTALYTHSPLPTTPLQSVREGCKQFVSSSGGNAGLAAAYCAKELGVPITVVVPEPTPEFIVKKLAEEGATVEVVGKVGKGRQCNQLLYYFPDFTSSVYGLYLHYTIVC